MNETSIEFDRNIKLAKKYMVESIYRSANIEGIGMTFPETQVICDGMGVSGHSVEDIEAVTGLKKAWQWFFANTNAAIDVDTLKTLNRILGKYTVINAGSIRTIYDEPIRVPLQQGKDYYPAVPGSEAEIDQRLKEIASGKNGLLTAFELFSYIAKGQFFNDGNKRTATLFTNIYMIQNCLGIFSIPVEKKMEFYTALTGYYAEESNKDKLYDFLGSCCVTPLAKIPDKIKSR